MAQQLIVEGKDAVVLTEILMKRKLNPPKGYTNHKKYKTEFVLEAGSYQKAKAAFKLSLKKQGLRNLGLIVDANLEGVETRFIGLKNLIESTLEIKLPKAEKLTKNGFTFQFEDLTVGVWIMPNNSENGYLEHFLGKLIDPKNETLQFAKDTVDELWTKEFCEFKTLKEVKKQKALLHTFLAWQKSPGLPMGTAVRSNFFNVKLDQAANFEKWFSKTFELE